MCALSPSSHAITTTIVPTSSHRNHRNNNIFEWENQTGPRCGRHQRSRTKHSIPFGVFTIGMSIGIRSWSQPRIESIIANLSQRRPQQQQQRRPRATTTRTPVHNRINCGLVGRGHEYLGRNGGRYTSSSPRCRNGTNQILNTNVQESPGPVRIRYHLHLIESAPSCPDGSGHAIGPQGYENGHGNFSQQITSVVSDPDSSVESSEYE